VSALTNTITLAVTAAVLVAGFLHALWNAMAKSFTDQWTSFTLINVGVTMPCLVIAPLVGAPVAAAWPYLAAAVVCHLLYELFLMSAYRHGALSRTYPIARGVAPMLVALGGLIFASEHVGVVAFFGIVLVVVGISSLAWQGRGHSSSREILWSLATGVAIATYTVIDGLGVRASHHPISYTAALFAMQGSLFLVGAFARRPGKFNISSAKVALGVSAGVISLVGYGIVLWAQTKAPLGVVSALRETGVLWAAVLGIYFFHERGGWRVVTAGAVVMLGVGAIALG
jgi:drug/metabolite transporter (DMT)-like permease